MGVGQEVLEWLQGHGHLQSYFLASSVGVFAVLYIMDFYMPPHLPRRYMLLWDGDPFVGRAIFALGLLLFLVSLFLRAVQDPALPVILTVCIGQLCIASVRWCFGNSRWRRLVGRHAQDSDIATADFDTKMEVLQSLIGAEKDIVRFYVAAFVAQMLNFFVVLLAWIVWAIHAGPAMNDLDMDNLTHEEKGLLFVLWIAPLMVACSNFVFGLFIFMRIFVHSTYVALNTQRNEIIAQALQPEPDREKLLAEHIDVLMQACRLPRPDHVYRRWGVAMFQTAGSEVEIPKQEMMEHVCPNLKWLVLVISSVACLFVFVLGILHGAHQLVYCDSTMASTVMEMVLFFFSAYLIFAVVCLNKVMRDLRDEIHHLYLWKMVMAIPQSNTARGLFSFVLLPTLPFILLISSANQCVRRARGIQPVVPEPEDAPARKKSGGSFRSQTSSRKLQTIPSFITTPDPQIGKPRCVTVWVHTTLRNISQWNWLEVTHKIHFICWVYSLYALCPLIVNITLAWVTSLIAGFPFWAILLMTFIVGLVAFLVPVVPGLVVYIFGGLVISDKCPWGFWAGSIINIGCSMFMKMAACTVQQKVIGERLGNSPWVQQTIGVHKMGVRCIEAVLREPGLSIGKVAVLCGGPDWPTSVLAGMLKLPLFDCLLGTLPIILIIIPCALGGSFYLRKDMSTLWKRLANSMIFLSTVVSIFLWAMVAWALQRKFEEKYDELKEPLPENVNLEWLDYRLAQIKAKTFTPWEKIPSAVRFCFLFGAVINIIVVHMLFWGYSLFFGTFNINDDPSRLKFFGDDGLVTPPGFAVVSLFAVGLCCSWVYTVWRHLKERDVKKIASRELASMEQRWKETWIAQATEVQSPSSKQGPNDTSGRRRSVVLESINAEMNLGLGSETVGVVSSLHVKSSLTERCAGKVVSSAVEAEDTDLPDSPCGTKQREIKEAFGVLGSVAAVARELTTYHTPSDAQFPSERHAVMARRSTGDESSNSSDNSAEGAEARGGWRKGSKSPPAVWRSDEVAQPSPPSDPPSPRPFESSGNIMKDPLSPLPEHAIKYDSSGGSMNSSPSSAATNLDHGADKVDEYEGHHLGILQPCGRLKALGASAAAGQQAPRAVPPPVNAVSCSVCEVEVGTPLSRQVRTQALAGGRQERSSTEEEAKDPCAGAPDVSDEVNPFDFQVPISDSLLPEVPGLPEPRQGQWKGATAKPGRKGAGRPRSRRRRQEAPTPTGPSILL